MSDCISNYELMLKKELRCGSATRNRLLERFHVMLATFTEENPAPDTPALESAFGKPKELANMLMEDTTEKERKEYIRGKRIRKGFAIGLALLLLLFTLYVFFIKSNPITHVHEIIDEGTTPSSTASN